MQNARSLGKHTLHVAYRWAKKAHVHQMLGAIIIIAHASEITRVVSHIKIWHILIAALLFVIWLSSEKDHESELA